jgi:hypothetical protein
VPKALPLISSHVASVSLGMEFASQKTPIAVLRVDDR